MQAGHCTVCNRPHTDGQRYGHCEACKVTIRNISALQMWLRRFGCKADQMAKAANIKRYQAIVRRGGVLFE